MPEPERTISNLLIKYRDEVIGHLANGRDDLLPDPSYGRLDALFEVTALAPGLSAANEIPPHPVRRGRPASPLGPAPTPVPHSRQWSPGGLLGAAGICA